ncbi:MAG: hypothetical protein AAFP00_15515, partial [Bacteroidota bacterium]
MKQLPRDPETISLRKAPSFTKAFLKKIYPIKRKIDTLSETFPDCLLEAKLPPTSPSQAKNRESMKYTLLTIILLLSHYVQAQSYEWNTLATGAGGWITGLDIHQTGHPIYARSDVGSAYRYNPNSQAWENIVTSTNLPVADVYWNQYGGVLSMVSAPSNP